MKGKVIFGLLLAVGVIAMVMMVDWSKIPYNIKKLLSPFGWHIGGGAHEDPSINDIVDNNEAVVDSLKKIISGYEERQIEYDTKIAAYNDSIALLSEQIQKDRQDIQYLRKKADEKIITVSKYSSHDIYEFLADRYGDALSK